MRVRVPVALVCISMAAACSAASPAPAGWQPVPGASGKWVQGAGDAEQRYSYETRAYDGTLQALASQQAVAVAQRTPRAKFIRSDVYAPCPGIAAIATFALTRSRTLDEGLSVQGGQAIVVGYERPAGAPTPQSVTDAMQRTLCLTR
ncbi:MAG: hypothetical protein JO160_05015 [Candidatus Eremiobacteraeota bacterium]|nr:hypothetical protein [Candidatus Eremiobacteraeota bacterium]MBV8284974.1 hypothetical protein [Candidatus Eremiobacteraeota bacterium]MBV8583860.1 hypothetical protein [Candidatus Eremiobacteraeota bacterium]MBV8655384.1 hypothetical protein [Candidatus Eremiobacteraeota bacterium]